MDNFLESYSLPKLNQEETDQLNKTVPRNEIEYIMNTLPTNKSAEPGGFTVKSTKHTKRNLYPSFLNFSKVLKKEHSPKHSVVPPSQNQTKILPKKKTIGQYL